MFKQVQAFRRQRYFKAAIVKALELDPNRGPRRAGLLVLGPVLDLEVGRLLGGQGLDEEVGGLEVGQDGNGEIYRQLRDILFL
jgi:hypothetical protein